MTGCFGLSIVIMLLCTCYYICAFPKQQPAKPICTRTICNLYKKISTLHSGDLLFVRKRRHPSWTDSVLCNYLAGHVILVLRYKKKVYGIDFSPDNNDIPIDTSHIKYIQHYTHHTSNVKDKSGLRIFSLLQYVYDSLNIYQSEYTVYTCKHVCKRHMHIQRTLFTCLLLKHIAHYHYIYPSLNQQLIMYVYYCYNIPHTYSQQYSNCCMFAYDYVSKIMQHIDMPSKKRKRTFYGVDLMTWLDDTRCYDKRVF